VTEEQQAMIDQALAALNQQLYSKQIEVGMLEAQIEFLLAEKSRRNVAK
jgi:hypothetical protein